MNMNGGSDRHVAEYPPATYREALEDERRRYRDFFESLPDGVLVTDIDGVIQEANHAAAALLDVPAAALIGKSLCDFVAYPERELFLKALHRVGVLDELRNRMIGIETLRGVRVEVLPAVFTVRDRAGAIIALRWHLCDITWHNRICETLRESEERLRSILQSTSDAILSIDGEGNVVFWNRGAEAIFGYTAEEMTGKPVTAIIPERFREAHRQGVKRASTAGRLTVNASMFELTGLRKDGTEFPLEFSLSAWHGKSGLFFTGIIRDITDRKRVEAALRESQERYALAVRGMNDGLWDWNLQTNEVYVSARCKELLGFEERDEEKTVEFFLTRLHPEDVERTLAAIRDHLDRRAPYDIEIRLKHKNGDYRWYQMRGQALWDEKGRATRMAGAICDITKRKWAEAALHTACEELEARVKARTADLEAANEQLMAKIIEHRETEQALHALNETLEERIKERTEDLLAYQQHLRALALELSRTEERERRQLASDLHDNLAQMLAFGKLKLAAAQGAQPSLRILDDLKELLDRALAYTCTLMADLRPVIHGDQDDLASAIRWVVEKLQHHGLEVSIHDDGEPKLLDEELLTLTYRAVHELLCNVLKHARTQKATVLLRRQDQRLQVVVEDQGAGFEVPDQVIPTKEGGFGLFHIRERIDLLGGRLDIRSVPGQGTRAVLTVPLKLGKPLLGQAAYAPDVSLPGRSGAQVGMSSKIRVLLVDDHQIMREGLRSILDGKADLEVVAEAPDGRTAVDVARRIKPDVVIMDVNMPGMNGVEATRRIKADLPQLEVIGLSVHEDDAMAAAMREAGASAYLSKGGAFETLCAAIREAGTRKRKAATSAERQT